MRRREFITLLGGATVTWPLAARAQQPDRMRRIGVLMGFPESDSQAQSFIAAFRDRLQKLGWCGSKGNYCKIKCNEKCQQRNSSKRSHLPTYFNYTSMARDYRWPSEWGRGYDYRGPYGWGYR